LTFVCVIGGVEESADSLAKIASQQNAAEAPKRKTNEKQTGKDAKRTQSE